MEDSSAPPREGVRVCGVNVPAEFVCPITHEVMLAPVLAMDGFVYEESAMRRWLAQSNRSPMTNEPLPAATLVPCHPIRALIATFLDAHPEVGKFVRRASSNTPAARPGLRRSISLGRRGPQAMEAGDEAAENPAAAGRRAMLTRGGSMSTTSGNLRTLLAATDVREPEPDLPPEDLLPDDNSRREGPGRVHMSALAGGQGPGALSVEVLAEFGEVPMDAAQRLHVLVSLKASCGAAAGQEPAAGGGCSGALGVDIVAVVDCSGSMHGTKLDLLLQALLFLSKRLRASDRLSIVAFNHRAKCVTPLRQMNEVGE